MENAAKVAENNIYGKKNNPKANINKNEINTIEVGHSKTNINAEKANSTVIKNSQIALDAAKATLDSVLTKFTSYNAADITKEEMKIIATPVASATIQIFMNLGQLSHLIDLLMHEVAKKLAINYQKSILSAGIAMAITAHLQQNEKDKGTNALAIAITSAIVSVVLTGASVSMQYKALNQTRQANKQTKFAEQAEKAEADLKAAGETPATTSLTDGTAGDRPEVQRARAQELLEAAKKSEIIGQAVSGLIPVVTSLIGAIGQNLNAKIEALSIELRSYLDMIQKAYALDKDRMDELMKILISLGEKKSEVTDKSINNTSRI
ncbi:hypothetical protein [Candidatus Regiella insecticola]|uniref:hypothetical protein n=1 Tax=Candidatus Regiella insecticola TaxID=138073 RepID=UPI00159DF185|nr:hypothetical protein [Candidatus Regiella insecticola]